MPDAENVDEAASPNPGAGNGGICVCPECGYEKEHDTGVPCTAMKCAKCGAKMQRKTDSVENDAIEEAIANAIDVDGAEEILLQVLESEDVSLLTLAEARVDELKNDGRERIEDTFVGKVEKIDDIEDAPSDGSVKFRAIVAQVDKINKNRRSYPRKQFEKNLPRVNRMMRAGRFTGQDGHPGFLSGGGPSNIVVRYDAVFIQGDNVYLEGALIPTSAGKDIMTLWEYDVQTEWSIIGYGDRKIIKADDSPDSKDYDEIRNYIWDGCDLVDRGAAKTQTVKFQKDSQEQLEQEEATIMDGETEVVEEVVEEVAENTPTPEVPIVVDTPVVGEVAIEPKEYQIDEAAIAERVAAASQKQVQSNLTDQILATHAAVDAARALVDAKASATASLSDGNEKVASLIKPHLDKCTTAEEVAEVVLTVGPQLKALFVKDQYGGIGIITGNEREKFWLPNYNGASDGRDRPETVDEVFRGLMEGIEDTGEAMPSNPAHNMRTILENYHTHYPNYFHACTRQGFQMQETVTTSTALGTTIPYLLPLVRSIFPKLIPYEIQSVQPLTQPTGRVYFLDFEYASGTYSGSDMDDSGSFDSTWSEHDEGDTKSQIALEFSSTDVTAVEKSIYYDITSVLMQDMKAAFGLDAEQELLSASVDQIAREINATFLEMLRAGATAATNEYGTAKPDDWESQGEWYNQGLSLWVNRTSSDISAKVYEGANWIIGDTISLALLKSMNQNWTSDGVPGDNQFGVGLTRAGTFANTYTVYEATWFTANTLLFGFKPDSWMRAAAVFSPYIPLYISPPDSDATQNRLMRSTSSRNAMEVLKGDGLATMAIASGTQGTEPF